MAPWPYSANCFFKLSFFRPQPYFWPQLFEGWIALMTLTEGFYGVEVTGNMALEIGDNLLRKHQQSIAKGGNNCDSDNPFWSSESLICSLLHFGCFSSKMTNSDLFCYFKLFKIFFGKFCNHGIVQKWSPQERKFN